MPRAARLLLPLVLLAGLAACHNDPFSVKPEVRGVKIPDKPAESQAEAPEETPESPASDQP